MILPYYQDSAVTIYHGDNREFDLGTFDLLLTDPPYGIGSLMKGGKDTGHWGSLSDGNEWDMETPEISGFIAQCSESIVWGGNYFALPPARCVLAWRKLNAVPTQADFELAWTNLQKPAKLFSSVSGGAMKRFGHPTEKPESLMSWCISHATKSETIFDPFAGSGTTGRAAKDLGKKATLIEREEKYCEIAAKRMQQEVFAL